MESLRSVSSSNNAKVARLFDASHYSGVSISFAAGFVHEIIEGFAWFVLELILDPVREILKEYGNLRESLGLDYITVAFFSPSKKACQALVSLLTAFESPQISKEVWERCYDRCEQRAKRFQQSDAVFVMDLCVKVLCKRNVSAYGNYEKLSRELSEEQVKEFKKFFALMKANLAVVFRCTDDEEAFFKRTITSFTDGIWREEKIYGNSVQLAIPQDFGDMFKVSNVANVHSIRFHWVVPTELEIRGAYTYVLLNLKSKDKGQFFDLCFSKGWVEDISATSFLPGRTFSLIGVTVILTPLGVANHESIIRMLPT
jgi:secreted Zn-dependent insulinase-like peptidase